jgi:autotransporter-associated beta strand protein
LGSGPCTFNGGTLLYTGPLSDSIAATSATINAGGGTVNISQSGVTLSVTGVIGGSGALTMAGSGILVLSASNTYLGGTNLAGGEVSISSDSNLGDPSGAVNFNGGLLQITGTSLNAPSRTFNFNNGGGLDIADPGNVFTLSQNVSISGSGYLTKLGAGTLILGGSNSFTPAGRGGVNVAAGTLQMANAFALGGGTNVVATVSGGTLDIGSYSPTLAGLTLAGGAIVSSGGGTVTIAPTSASGGITTNASATINVPVYVGAAQAWTTAAGQTLTINGPISGQGNSINGNGNVVISGSMNNADINLDTTGGTVTYNGPGGKLNRFDLGSYNSGNTFLQTAGSLNLPNTTNANVNLYGGGAAASWNMSGGTFTGAGTWYGSGPYQQYGGNANNCVVSYNFSGGSFNWTSGHFAIGNAGTGNMTISGSAYVSIPAAVLSYSSSFGGPNGPTPAVRNISVSSLNLNGGTLATAIISEENTNNPGNSTWALVASSTSTVNFNGGVLRATASDSSSAPFLTYVGNAVVQDNGAIIDTQSYSVSAGVSLVHGGISPTDGGLTKLGSGMLTLSGMNSYNGGTTVNAGTLQVGNTLALGSTNGNLAVNGAATLDLHGFSPTVAALSGSGTIDDIGGGGPTLTVGANDAFSTFNGVIQNSSGAVNVTKTGSGTLLLTGNNTYSGVTTVNAGGLAVNGSLASNSTIYVNGGLNGTLSGAGTVGNVQIWGAGLTPGYAGVGPVLTASSVSLLSGSLLNYTLGSVGAAGNSLLNVTGGLNVSSNITLNVTPVSGWGNGTYELASFTGTPTANFTGWAVTGTGIGSHLYSFTDTGDSLDVVVSPTGATTVSGTWTNTNNGTSSWTGAGNWAGSLVPTTTNDTALFGSALSSGTATVTLDGSHTLSGLTFNNTAGSYSITIGTGGNLTLVATSGAVTLANSGGSHSISAPIALGSNLNVTGAAGSTLTIAGSVTEINAGMSLNLSGNGTLALTGTDSYSGGTTVNGGTLDVNNAHALPTSGVLVVGRSGRVVLGNITGAAEMVAASPLTSASISLATVPAVSSVDSSLAVQASSPAVQVSVRAGGPVSGGPAAVPEPGTVLLLLVGAAALAAWRRWKQIASN